MLAPNMSCSLSRSPCPAKKNQLLSVRRTSTSYELLSCIAAVYATGIHAASIYCLPDNYRETTDF